MKIYLEKSSLDPKENQANFFLSSENSKKIIVMGQNFVSVQI